MEEEPTVPKTIPMSGDIKEDFSQATTALCVVLQALSTAIALM